MSQTRLMTSVVTTAAQISSGAVLTLAGKTQTTKTGLEVVPDLIRLVATTIGRSSMMTHEQEVVLEALLCRLIRRYGTMRSALESIASSRRKHSLACAEKAAAWVQVMVVSPSAIEVTMRRHGWLTAAIKIWVEERSGTLSQLLTGYLSWLDGPLTDFDDTSPSLPWERLASPERKHVIPVGDGSGFGLEAAGSTDAGPVLDRERSSVIPFDAIPGARVGMQGGGGGGHDLEEALPPAKRFACADVEMIWRTVFEDKRPMEQAGDREFTADQQAALERLEAGHEPLGCAVAMIARRSFGDADSIIPHLEGRVDAHHLAMLRGHRYDLEGRYDEAAEMFRMGCAESGDAASQRALAVALLRGHRGSKRTRVGEAIRRLREVLRTTPEGSL